jgi:hypothetical protein
VLQAQRGSPEILLKPKSHAEVESVDQDTTLILFTFPKSQFLNRLAMTATLMVSLIPKKRLIQKIEPTKLMNSLSQLICLHETNSQDLPKIGSTKLTKPLNQSICLHETNSQNLQN